MLTSINFLKPLATLWQFFMTDKLQTIGSITRFPPDAGSEGPEGFSYTLRMPTGATREVFLFHDVGTPLTVEPQYMSLVALGAEGDNFYNTPRKSRFTNEAVTQDMVEAVRTFNVSEDVKKKFEDGPAGLEGNSRRVRQAATLIH